MIERDTLQTPETMTPNDTIKQMVLAWPTELKLNSIRNLVDEGKIGMAIQISNILLEAPMKDGGVPSELIQDAMMGSN
jgi:hypothetical protein